MLTRTLTLIFTFASTFTLTLIFTLTLTFTLMYPNPNLCPNLP